jgi:hypothetical protein
MAAGPGDSDIAAAADAGTPSETTATADTPAEDAPPAAGSTIAAPMPVANPERTRLDILEALERGEINADDALRLLRRLEI